ncbi:hypothetical protein B0I35DRAFT_441127 [Stachybotrys elegans]|uniref:Uncharacterized protein n=1 Tax=Stachybotrys elegans TaxID=80388 RepID=A0A8K0WML7_9HYPO|nr:hypothetical protein B0I35DRAFT_441127 [Stachybotrys elegans]
MTMPNTASPRPEDGKAPVASCDALGRTDLDGLQPAWSKDPQRIEPCSINDILRKHSRERLYVKPLHWTSKQLHHLGCDFAVDPPPHDKKQNTDDVDKRLVRSMAEAVRQLAPWREQRTKAMAIDDALHDHGLHRTSFEIHLSFAQKPVCRLRTCGIFSIAGSTSAFMAYLDYNSVAHWRYSSVKMSSSKRGGWPVICLEHRKRDRIKPPHFSQDPYIAAVLIALAQERRRSMESSEHASCLARTSQPAEPVTPLPDLVGTEPEGSHCPKARQARVSVLATIEKCMYIYTADMPFAFLDRLDMPSRFSHAETVPLSYRCFPYRSVKKISRRIQRIIRSVETHDVISSASHTGDKSS